MTIPAVAVSVGLVVCAFNGGVLGTGMLGAAAEAKARQPDPTVPVPLAAGPSASNPTTTATSLPNVIVLAPSPLPNPSFIVLTPPSSPVPAGPALPIPLTPPNPTTAQIIPAPPPAPSATLLSLVIPPPVIPPPKATPRSTRSATTTAPAASAAKSKKSGQTTTSVAYELETIQALPTAPVPLATTQTTFPISPLPTLLITPVLTRNTPTVPTTPTTAPTPTTTPAPGVSPTVPVPLDTDGSAPPAPSSPATPSDTDPPTNSAVPTIPTIPTTTKPKVYAFVGRQDYDVVPPSSPLASDVVTWAIAQVGQPYLWGGEGIGGFDCSGLSKMAWLSVGTRLTHQSRVQFSETSRLNVGDLEPGDLVFYGDPIHHLGIYIGDGKMVEAPRQGIPVRIAAIKRRDLVGAGRVRY